MTINSVFSKEFDKFGKVFAEKDFSELLDKMGDIPFDDGVSYRPSIKELEDVSLFDYLRDNMFGGMPIQIGMCWGHNTRLNCLEYHKNSEVNIGSTEFILLVASLSDVVDGKIDSSSVKAFWVPANTAVELYATTLHYAPAKQTMEHGFRVAIVLPRGTNTDLPGIERCSLEDSMLFACNKWLIAHPESTEAQNGAFVGIEGENIDLSL